MDKSKEMSVPSLFVRDKGLAVFTFALAAFVSFVHLSNFSLSIDEEIASFSAQDWKAWAAQGRWGMAILNLLLPNSSAIPFISTLIFVFSVSIAALLIAQSVAKNRSEALIFSGFFVTSPIWLHIVEFNTVATGVGIGLIATAFAVQLISVGRLISAIYAGLCVGFAIGVYQALVIIYAIACVVLLFPGSYFWCDDTVEKLTASCRQFINVAISFAVAFVFYLSTQKFFLALIDQHITYIDSYIQIDELRRKFFQTAHRILHQAMGLLFGTDPTYLGWGRPLLLLPAGGFLYGLIKVVRHGITCPRRASISLLAVTAMIVAAVALVIMAAGRMPTRALIGFPLLFAVLSVNSFRIHFFKTRGPQWIAFSYAMLIAGWIGASLFYADQVARQRDQLLATRLAAVIDSVGRPVFGNNIPFVLVGDWTFPHQGVARRVQIFGTSFFQQDGGNPYRVADYLRLLGIEGLKPLPITDIRNYMFQINKMPAWPAQGSVSVVNHILVIKLGGITYQQHLLLDNKHPLGPTSS